MDFTRLNNEFLNMQKKLEDNEICIKKLKLFIKSIDKEKYLEELLKEENSSRRALRKFIFSMTFSQQSSFTISG